MITSFLTWRELQKLNRLVIYYTNLLLDTSTFYIFKFVIFQFPQSNLRVIMDDIIKCVHEKGGIKPMMAQFLYKDPDDTGYINESTFR